MLYVVQLHAAIAACKIRCGTRIHLFPLAVVDLEVQIDESDVIPRLHCIPHHSMDLDQRGDDVV
jgi:hypothetical protein